MEGEEEVGTRRAGEEGQRHQGWLDLHEQMECLTAGEEGEEEVGTLRAGEEGGEEVGIVTAGEEDQGHQGWLDLHEEEQKRRVRKRYRLSEFERKARATKAVHEQREKEQKNKIRKR